jgi:hypothetical protein
LMNRNAFQVHSLLKLYLMSRGEKKTSPVPAMHCKKKYIEALSEIFS